MQQLKIVRGNGRWICRIPGPEEAIVIGDTREQVADFLALLECVRFGSNGAIYVTMKPRKGSRNVSANACCR
jgi:hypothetical protein